MKEEIAQKALNIALEAQKQPEAVAWYLTYWKELIVGTVGFIGLSAKPVITAFFAQKAKRIEAKDEIETLRSIVDCLVITIEEYDVKKLKNLAKDKSFQFGVADELHDYIEKNTTHSSDE